MRQSIARSLVPASMILGAAMAVGACAPTGETSPGGPTSRAERPCFYADQVRNFANGPSQVLYIRSIRNEVFELSASGLCRDLDNAIGIGLTPLGGSSSRTCVGDWVQAVVPPSGLGDSPCRLQVVKRLTPEEVAALDGRYRP